MNDIFVCLNTLKTSLIAKRGSCTVYLRYPQSCFKLLRILYDEGFILSYLYDSSNNSIFITHNYYKNKPAISILSIFNKASFPVYIKYTDLSTIHRFGIDILILSTSKGLMPHYKALKLRLGGRVICYIK